MAAAAKREVMELGKSGHTIPVDAFGTWRCDTKLLKDAIMTAAEAGVRHFDCASIYMNQALVGEALASTGVDRKDLFITSKVAPTESAPEDAAASLAKTLADLKTDYLDLLLIHWPARLPPKPSKFPVPLEERLGYTPEGLLETWRALEKAVESGLVRSIGVSNCSPSKVEKLCASATIMPVVNQLELHPYLPQDDVLAWHADHGIVVTGYSPLGSPGRPAQYRGADDPPDLISNDVLKAVAAKRGRTTAQVMLRWALQRKTIPIWRSTTPSRIAENVAIHDFALTDDDMAAIAKLATGFRWNKGDSFQVAGQSWEALWL